MENKNQDFPAKISKKRPFKFQVNVARLTKKARHIRLAEESLLSKLKNFSSLKIEYRGNKYDYDSYDKLVYQPILNLCNLFYEQLSYGDFTSKYWSSDSEVLGYIHDVTSVSGTPDYTLKKEVRIDNTSVEILLGMFTKYMKRNGSVRLSKKKYTETCKWLIVHLNNMVNRKCIGIRYTRDTNFKSKHNVVNKDFSIPICISLIDMLIEYDLIVGVTGNKLFGNKNMSMIIPSGNLLNILLIEGNYRASTIPKSPVKILDNNDNLVCKESLSDDMLHVYEESVETLTSYKDMMERKTLSLQGYEIPEYWLQRTLRVDKEINSRLFDDGTVQSKSKILRGYLEIDNEKTISLDFKSIHPAMLLQMEGYSLLLHDPYPKIKDIKVDTKLVNKFKKFYGLGSYDPVRNIVKKLVLCLINADNINNAVGSCYDDIHNDNLKRGTYKEDTMRYVGLPQINLHEVAKVLIDHNHMISKYFGVGIGNELQYKDSCIIMESLKVLIDRDIPCLPVHDALICKESDYVEVETVMAESFVKVVGHGSDKNCIIEKE